VRSFELYPFCPGVLQKHKWENCMTIDSGSWGYRRNARFSDYLSTHDLITELASTVSCGGNLLMNVGPTSDGIISPIFEERLRQFGAWMGVNGDAIYASKPWKFQNDTVTPGVWYTSKKSDSGLSVYAILLSWPKGGSLTLASATPTSQTTISMLGYSGSFSWKKNPTMGIDVTIPPIPSNKLPCEWAWTLKLENLA
jgi:alpha-L-fucosidase